MKAAFTSVLMLSAGVSAHKNTESASPVTKVIELINELKVKVQKDLDAESKAMAEYTTFCDDETTQKGFAIKTAGSEIEGYKAVIEDTTGSISQLASEVDTASSETASKGEELKSATGIRNNENEDFKKAEKELVDTVDTLSRAITIIKREMSFVQSGKKSKSEARVQINKLTGALDQIITAAWIDTSSRSKLKNFMSTDMDMDDELSLHAQQPQASVKNYESKSGGIVSTLEDMKDKAESTLNNLRREEMNAKHSFEMIKQSLSDSMTNLNKEIDEAQAQSAAAQQKNGKAQGDLSSTEESKKADEEYVARLTTDCKSKAAEWEERQKAARGEMEALNKGVEILSAKFGFVQISSGRKVTDDSFAARDKVVSMLKSLGRRYNSFGLMQIANAAGKDAFAKVRGLIESMISKLQQQAQEEATHDAFCKEETVKSAKAKETKQSNVDKYQARIDEAKAAMAELKNEVATLSTEVSEIADASAKATQIRGDENADYKAASKDFKEAAEAVTQAMVVLKDFYKGGESFIQTSQPEFGSARSDASHMIIEILETAQSDFTKLLAESETSESEAVESFKSLMQENKVSKSKKETAIKAKTSELKSIEVALTHHNQDYDNESSELSAVMDYIQKLKPQCESKAMTYEERKARREAEVAGLQEALTILEGEDVAAFIQKKGFMHKKL